MVKTTLVLKLYFLKIFIIYILNIITVSLVTDGICVFHMYVSVYTRGDDFTNKLIPSNWLDSFSSETRTTTWITHQFHSSYVYTQ